MAEHRIQRRLAAVLVADVVGYSRLVAADEAGTLSRLKTLRAEVIAQGVEACLNPTDEGIVEDGRDFRVGS